MDFMNRGVRTNSAGHQAETTTGGVHQTNQKPSKLGKGNLSLGKLGVGLGLAAVVAIAIALLSSAVFTKAPNESQYVDKSKFQAVFLNGGQVYFGKISDLNKQYLKVSNIYYLRVNQQVQPDANSNAQNDISLVKLGCELHGPQDDMVINREQVIFWENLKDDGQVAKAVAEYVKQNPNGQKCETGNSGASTNTNTGNTTNTNNTSNTNSTTPSTTNNTRR
jgi:hypothetical protein